MMALMQLLSVSCGPARGQTKQREGRKFHAGSSNRWKARPTEEKDGRESRRKATRSAAATPLPANGISRTTSDPPSSRGAELPLLSYSYSALVSENMRKWVSTQSKTGASAPAGATYGNYFRVVWTRALDQFGPVRRKNGKLFPIPLPGNRGSPSAF
jgi:hypothetical protein